MIIPNEVLRLVKPLDFKSMYELGNKNTYGTPYSVYYKEKNIIYSSIDINGKDGALKLDLNTELKLTSRDMVTNIGVAEHVSNQEMVFLNIHNLSHGRMVHWLPLNTSYKKNHGLWMYDSSFIFLLAALNNYKQNKSYILIRDNGITVLCTDFSKQDKEPFKWHTYFLKKITKTEVKIRK